MPHTTELHDVGHKPSKAEVAGPSPRKPYYPTFYINADVPGMDDLKMGQTLRAVIEFKVTGFRKQEGSPSNFDLEIRKVGGVYAVGRMKGEGTLAHAMSEKDASY